MRGLEMIFSSIISRQTKASKAFIEEQGARAASLAHRRAAATQTPSSDASCDSNG